MSGRVAVTFIANVESVKLSIDTLGEIGDTINASRESRLVLAALLERLCLSAPSVSVHVQKDEGEA